VDDNRPALTIGRLTTERLELTRLDPEADAADLHVMLADPEVHRFDTDAGPSGSIRETRQRLRGQLAANGGATWAIRLHAGPAIGTVGVYADQGTTIRGIGWSLASAHWGRGIASEAARIAVAYLLSQPGVDGLEAWVDSDNLASIGVARAARMTERGRLPRVYADRVAQTVVMARAAVPADPEVFAATPTLLVADLETSVRVLRQVLALHVLWQVPDPPTLAFLGFGPWSASPGFRVQQSPGARRAQPELLLEVGISVDVIAARVHAAGLRLLEPPTERPWYRREVALELPGGETVRISGPSSPYAGDDGR
jgi:RimJ/RimL family protein N-acetyltransferase/catechol 2,3-dioxygenase-like lactoylglutathione lyase family enzyme